VGFGNLKFKSAAEDGSVPEELFRDILQLEHDGTVDALRSGVFDQKGGAGVRLWERERGFHACSRVRGAAVGYRRFNLGIPRMPEG